MVGGLTIKTATRRKPSFLKFPVIDPHFTQRDKSRFFGSKSMIYTTVARYNLKSIWRCVSAYFIFYIYDGNRRLAVSKHNKIAHLLTISVVVLPFLIFWTWLRLYLTYIVCLFFAVVCLIVMSSVYDRCRQEAVLKFKKNSDF